MDLYCNERGIETRSNKNLKKPCLYKKVKKQPRTIVYRGKED